MLVDQATDGGLQNFFRSFGFGGECLGQHEGANQAANLGDGNGYVNETAEMRWDYGDPQFGTCKESIQGGDHFRYWAQNGLDGNRCVYYHRYFTQRRLYLLFDSAALFSWRLRMNFHCHVSAMATDLMGF